MLDEIRKIKSGPKELKEFAVTFAVFFLLLTGLLFWRHHIIYLHWIGLAGLFLFFGFVYPYVLWPLQKAWMTLALLLGWVMSRVILSILFFIVITPMALILRLLGRRFMELTTDKSAGTYWHLRTQDTQDKNSCETQY